MAVHKNSPQIVTNGLVLYYDAANPKSYVGTGTTWNDLSGNGNTGTLTNGTTYNTLNAGSMLLDGVDDCVVGGVIEPTYFTLSTWFRANAAPTLNNDTSGMGLIVSNPQLFNGSLQYFLSYSWLNQRVVFLVQSNGTLIATPDNTVLRNQIYNVVGTYNGTTMSLYINGVLVVSNGYTTNPIYPTSGDRNVQIGRWGYGSYQRNLNGNIYQAMIYNRALSATEVLQNYQATKGRFS